MATDSRETEPLAIRQASLRCSTKAQ